MLCDFHTHSTVSDGSLTPSALLDEAAREGVGALALTDHDTLGGLDEAAQRASRLGIDFLPGVEISASDQAGAFRMHVLGLGIDPGCASLSRRLDELTHARAQRARRMVELLGEHGIALDFARVQEIAGPGSIGRPHLARALVEAGACSDEDDAFTRWLRHGRPAHVEHYGMSSEEAIRLIHEAGGIASLAHPPLSFGVDRPGGLEAFIERLVPLGLDGIETVHPAHRVGHAKRLRRYARSFELVETGGSDFHGASRPEIRLGRGRGRIHVGKEMYEAIRARIARRRDNPRVLTPQTPAGNLVRPS